MAPAGGRRYAALAVVLMVALYALGTSTSLGLAAVIGYVPGRALVKFLPGTPASEVARAHANARARIVGEIPQLGVQVVSFPARRSVDRVVGLYAHNPNVVFAEPEELATPDAVPNDPSYPNQWHLAKIGCATAWDTTVGNSAVTIAILDTGVDGTHPDLAAKLVPGWNTYDNNSNTADVYGHGTGVAGTAAAYANNGTGVASIAWDCRIMPVRVSRTDGAASSSTVSAGLTWAADHGARVANISYSFSGNATVASAARYFLSKGGVVTMSAGNDSAALSYADNPYVLTVGATGTDDSWCNWSNTGDVVDVAAPGVSILTTARGGGYWSPAGTSFSAPVVAGVAALVFSANPSLTGEEVQDIICASADDRGAPGWDAQFGWGRVNAAAAVEMALGGGQTPPPADTTPPALAFMSPAAGEVVSGVVSLQLTASDDVGVASVAVSVDGGAAGTDTAAPYTFAWDSTTASDGVHTLTATATDTSGNTVTVQRSVTVANTVPEVADEEAPAVQICSPLEGSKRGASLTVQIASDDNVGVTRVYLYVDQKLAASSTEAQPQFRLNTKKWARGAHVLQALAYDAAGNAAWSPAVTVYK